MFEIRERTPFELGFTGAEEPFITFDTAEEAVTHLFDSPPKDKVMYDLGLPGNPPAHLEVTRENEDFLIGQLKNGQCISVGYLPPPAHYGLMMYQVINGSSHDQDIVFLDQFTRWLVLRRDKT